MVIEADFRRKFCTVTNIYRKITQKFASQLNSLPLRPLPEVLRWIGTAPAGRLFTGAYTLEHSAAPAAQAPMFYKLKVIINIVLVATAVRRALTAWRHVGGRARLR
jgi:hypothetical protein